MEKCKKRNINKNENNENNTYINNNEKYTNDNINNNNEENNINNNEKCLNGNINNKEINNINNTNYIFNEIKPKLRGCFHGLAFLFTIVSAVLFFISSILKRFDFGILIYIISQLLQYGISAFYHIRNWKPRARRFLQHLDHICIFILISGTQTSVLLNSIGDIKKVPLAPILIKLSWTISAIGILKILITNKLHNIFDLVLYIIHGAIIAPFYKVLQSIPLLDKILIWAGGVFYIQAG